MSFSAPAPPRRPLPGPRTARPGRPGRQAPASPVPSGLLIGLLAAVLVLAGPWARPVPAACLAPGEAGEAGQAEGYWRPCPAGEAVAGPTDPDPDRLLAAARCLVVAAETDKQAKLAHARQGRDLAEAAVRLRPESGEAHYLLAYLTGQVADESRLRALSLVPVIEQEAARAAALAPDLDCAGPDRMLGELYRQAPGRPWSIGDPAKAVVHFRRAAALAPDSVANRLGLAQALLAAGTGPGPIQEACALLRSIGEERADSPEAAARAEAGELLARRCGK